MATGGNVGKLIRTLQDFNFVKKRKVDETQDENNRGSSQVKMCFVGPPFTLLATLVPQNLFVNPRHDGDGIGFSCSRWTITLYRHRG